MEQTALSPREIQQAFEKNRKMPINDASQAINPFAAAGRQREDLKYAKRQMNVLMDICGKFADMAPTGMKEYIEFNLAAFKAADKAFDLVDKYAEKIETALNDIDELFRNVQNDQDSFNNRRRKGRNNCFFKNSVSFSALPSAAAGVILIYGPQKMNNMRPACNFQSPEYAI